MSGNVLKRTRFSRVQLKVLETLMPIIRRVDRMLPWNGLSVVAVAVKPQ